MMNTMVVSVLGVVVTMGLVAADAAAGYRVTSPFPEVTYQRDSSGNVTVRGSLGAAHNANNPNTFIQCHISGYGDINSTPPSDSYEAECRANNGSFVLGQEPNCWVHNSDMNLVRALMSINGSSHVEFKYNDSLPNDNRNRCSEITVENGSKYLPKNADVLNVFKKEVVVASDVTGALGSARNSSDTTQQIGCDIYGDGGFKQARCWGTDANGVNSSCTTQRPNMLFSLSALKPDSYLEFNDSDECTRVRIINSSKYRPSY